MPLVQPAFCWLLLGQGLGEYTSITHAHCQGQVSGNQPAVAKLPGVAAPAPSTVYEFGDAVETRVFNLFS